MRRSGSDELWCMNTVRFVTHIKVLSRCAIDNKLKQEAALFKRQYLLASCVSRYRFLSLHGDVGLRVFKLCAFSAKRDLLIG